MSILAYIYSILSKRSMCNISKFKKIDWSWYRLKLKKYLKWYKFSKHRSIFLTSWVALNFWDVLTCGHLMISADKQKTRWAGSFKFCLYLANVTNIYTLMNYFMLSWTFIYSSIHNVCNLKNYQFFKSCAIFFFFVLPKYHRQKLFWLHNTLPEFLFWINILHT